MTHRTLCRPSSALQELETRIPDHGPDSAGLFCPASWKRDHGKCYQRENEAFQREKSSVRQHKFDTSLLLPVPPVAFVSQSSLTRFECQG
jgi:hypothetical protein